MPNNSKPPSSRGNRGNKKTGSRSERSRRVGDESRVRLGNDGVYHIVPASKPKPRFSLNLRSRVKKTMAARPTERQVTQIKYNTRLIICVAVLIAVLLTTWYLLTYKNSYELTVNGTSIGYIAKNKELTAKELYDHAAAQLKTSLGVPIQIEQDASIVELTEAHAKSKLISDAHAITSIRESLTYKLESAAISVNGASIGIVSSMADAQAILDMIMKRYITDESKVLNDQSGFVEDVRIDPVFVDDDELVSEGEMLERMSITSSERIEYVIEPGDMLGTIAKKAGITMAQLLEINPDYTQDTTLRVGDTLNLMTSKPFLSVRIVEEHKTTETLPMTTEEREDPTMYQGVKKLSQPGKDGQVTYTYNITYINGSEIERTKVSEDILEQPITQITLVGTKPVN